jgi:phosphohistidine phosphatase SixA
MAQHRKLPAGCQPVIPGKAGVSRRVLLGVSIAAPVLLALPRLATADALWLALRDGSHLALMRHALAPGVGDPPGFELDECATQRNLSAAGRAQAAAIGSLFRANGVTSAAIYSSQWCRCLETAALLDLGKVKPLAFLNSFFESRESAATQTAELRSWVAGETLAQPTILVTHQVNITAASGINAASGEVVVVDRSLGVIGRIRTD